MVEKMECVSSVGSPCAPRSGSIIASTSVPMRSVPLADCTSKLMGARCTATTSPIKAARLVEPPIDTDDTSAAISTLVFQDSRSLLVGLASFETNGREGPASFELDFSQPMAHA